MPGNDGSSERKMFKFSVYLYRECSRAKQEGVIWMTNPKNDNDELHFDYLDQIPEKIRQHLKMIGLRYDVAENCDNSVITTNAPKRKVIRKIRRGDAEA